MGAGSYPAGTGLAGRDPSVVTDRRGLPAPPAVRVFDETLDYQLTADGHFERAHPVDVNVWLALRAVQGQIRSAPNTGQTVGLIRYIDSRIIQRQVEERLRQALARLVNRGSVRIDSIVVDTQVKGRAFAEVNYANLEAAGKPLRTATL